MSKKNENLGPGILTSNNVVLNSIDIVIKNNNIIASTRNCYVKRPNQYKSIVR
jgi:hypothetical protein